MNPLQDRLIALSISDSPDRAKLNFPKQEIDRALFTICVALARAGATILYAGDLRPDGFTFKVFRHIARAYADEARLPFTHVIPEPVLRRTTFEALSDALKERRGTAATIFGLGERFEPVRWGDEAIRIGEGDSPREIGDNAAYLAWLAEIQIGPPPAVYTAVRREMTRISQGRVAIGGKMGLVGNADDQYEGAMPGVIEEAITSLEQNKAIVLLGAFGGATRDMTIALDLLAEHAGVPRGDQAPSYAEAIAKLRALKDRIPAGLRDRLKSIADDDRIEYVAHEIRDILAAWPP